LALGRLRTLGTVLRTCLATILHALQVERAANDVVANTGKILYTTATHQNHRVFLQVVAFAANVRNHFVTVGQANLGDLTQSRVRLLRGGGVDAGANTTTMRAVLKSRALAFDLGDFA